ncbi:HTH-type transcriptional activator IlvY [Neptunicella marina]|uniref:HTH-type transcriptional activator IlvY n=1 Tax=Neptunicella marina TaxID=2125989 RepID=A0A8J6LZ80_9ALTE|nr:HTH-type transcriptional activator IlvY [Neptunicella marina]MBC3766494.1 HTH-type transcriptional activator IlvY [Neptunicella marina]
MDFRSLQLFHHLSTSLHFGKTADALYVSPSTLSRVIQRLEQECGSELFVRDNRSVKLTAAGEQLRDFADDTLRQWSQLKSQLNDKNQQLRGEVKLFCSVTASYSHLPKLLDNFSHLHPQVEIQLTTGDPDMAVQKLLNREVDVAIAVVTPDFPAELHHRHLDNRPLVMITPASSKVTKLEQVNWREMQMVLPESGPSKRIVHHWLAEHGIRPRVYGHVAGHEAIVSMVALGCGLGIVPKVVVDNSVARDKVNCIVLHDIESFKLGICCLSEKAGDPLVESLMAAY